MSKNQIEIDGDIFNMSEDQREQVTSFLDTKRNLDGIYRPGLEVQGVDPKKGYVSEIRFLYNLTRDGKIGKSAIEKSVHYVKLKNFPDLNGYYECEKNHTTKCKLCTMYWALAKSDNQLEVKKAESIQKTPKWYSYVMIIKDDHQPDLVGKIMIFPYGIQIQKKIDVQSKGLGRPKCDIFDLAVGKNFSLVIMEKTKTEEGKVLPTYEFSDFLESSPIQLYDEKHKKWLTAPLDENGKISDPKWKKKITETLLARDPKVNLEDHIPTTGWSEEEQGKVDKILAILKGDAVAFAEESVNRARTGGFRETQGTEFFDDFSSPKNKPATEVVDEMQTASTPTEVNMDSEDDDFFK